MAQTLAHSLSIKLADTLNQYVYKEGLEYKKVVLGAEVIIINVSKSIVVFALSLCLGVWVQTLLALIGFNLLRRTAFGVHALSSIGCTLSSCCLFVAIPYFIKDFSINNYTIAIIFLFTLIALFFFAPADTEARPLIGAGKRSKLKRTSLLVCFVLMILLLCLPYADIKLMATWGAVVEAIFILPITYKVLGRRRNNYGEYERGNEQNQPH